MRNILPLETNVKLTSYPYLSNYLSILEAHKYNYSGIIFNNYIELFYKPWKGQIRFLNQRYLQSNFEIEKFSFPLSEPLKFIINNINKNKYIVVVLKLNNVHLNNGFRTLNTYHDWLIYGYDNNKKKIYIAGYLRKKRVNVYQKFEISFCDFISSLPKSDDVTNYKSNIMYNHLCNIKENYIPEKIDSERIRNVLKRYIYKFPPLFFNRSIYKRLIFHIILFSKSNYIPHNRLLLDIRDFRTIYEHTVIIEDLLHLFSSNDDLIIQYSEAKNCALSLVLLVYRYQDNLDSNRKQIIQKNSIERIKNIDKIEKSVLKKLIKEL